MKRHGNEEAFDEAHDGPSKTQVKQAMHELQDLGLELLKLPAAHLAAIPMDERLREALHEVPRMPTRESRRRLLQYVGKLLRDTDAEPARRALIEYRTGDARTLQEAERWREALLAGDAALTEWMKLYPQTDVQPLRVLIRNARRELAALEAADPGNATARGKSKAFRELFQKLRATLQAAVILPAQADDADRQDAELDDEDASPDADDDASDESE